MLIFKIGRPFFLKNKININNTIFLHCIPQAPSNFVTNWAKLITPSSQYL